LALEKYWRPFDFTLSFPARKNDSCFAHNILNILNILNIWTFEQKLQWYLVKKFLCSARASTIPPKKTYSLSRKKNRNPCLLGCTTYLHIRVKINQKLFLWKWVFFCIMKRIWAFFAKLFYHWNVVKWEKNEFSNQVVIGLKK